MTRAFVALQKSSASIVDLLEKEGYEAIPLTSDSIIENIRSLESSNFVIVDGESPPWVIREIQEHHLMSVAYCTYPLDHQVTALVDSIEKMNDLLVMLKPLIGALKPVDREFAKRLALVTAMFPVPRVERTNLAGY